MREITLKLYQFEELPEKAKDKAISDYGARSGDDWHESVYDDAHNVKVHIDAFDIDRGDFCEIEFQESAETTAELILKNHGETCDTYQVAKDYNTKRDATTNEAAIDNLHAEFKKALGRCYLKMLRKEYDHQNSAEYITEILIANEYEFTEEGKFYHKK